MTERKYLGKPEPQPYIDEDDLLELAGDLGWGYHSVERLYQWYGIVLKQEGRERVTKKVFGLALKEAGWQSSVQWMPDDRKNVRCWLITKPWQRRAQARDAQEKADYEARQAEAKKVTCQCQEDAQAQMSTVTVG